MDATQFVGYAAAALITAANIPQAYVIIRDKSTRNISVATYLMLFCGGVLWVIYGISNSDWPIILCNGVAALTCGIILLLNFCSASAIRTIHKAVIPKKISNRQKNGKG